MDDERTGAARPAWLEKARCSSLDTLATTVGASAATAAKRTQAELAAIAADEEKSVLAIDLETEVRLGAAEAELGDEIAVAIDSSRHDLSQTIRDAAIDCESGDGKATLVGFDKDAAKLQKAALCDFGAAVSSDGVASGGAVLSFAEKMKQAREKAAAAIKRAQALEAADGPTTFGAPKSSEATAEVRLRDRQSSAPKSSRKSVKLAVFAAAGLAGIAAIGIGVVSLSEKDASSAPLVDELANRADDAPLGAGSPDRLREFQRTRKERLQKARADAKRRSPVRKKTRKPVTTRPRRKAGSAPVTPASVEGGPSSEPADDPAEPGSDESGDIDE